MKKNIVIFASGTGSNFVNIYQKIKFKNLDAKICLLISNNPECGAVNFASSNKIDVYIYNNKIYPNDLDQLLLLRKLDAYNIDLILLAGYMKKISSSIIKKFKNKIMNIHPSLLPLYGGKGFYGMRVHNAVFKNKDQESGATVHFVDYGYDTGPILMQEKIKIELGEGIDAIAKKVLNIEHKIYFEAVELFCNNKIYWNNNKPLIKRIKN